MLSLLDPAVPLNKVAAHVRKRWRQHQRVELELSLGLRRLFRDNIHRGTGTGNFASWAGREFDMPPKLVWTFSLLGEHLERLPMLVEAMESGAVTYTKAREFAASIRPEDQAEWIEYARTHTNREVEKRVGKWNAEQKGEEFVEKKKVVSKLTGLQAQTVRNAREELLKTTNQVIPEPDILPVLATMFMEGTLVPAGGEVGDQAANGEGDEPGKLPGVSRPYLTINACPSCLTTYVPVPGANMPVAAFEFLDRLRKAEKGGDVVSLARHFFCDCDDAMHRRDECPHLPQEQEIPEKQVSRYVSAAAKKLIEARDGFRCRVPGCLNELPLEGGHIHPFAENGPPSPENMATQCKACNALIEEGRLRVEGVAPYEKYYTADGSFLGYGYDPTPFARPEPPVQSEGSDGLSHVGQDDGDDGSGRICESSPVWNDSAAP